MRAAFITAIALLPLPALAAPRTFAELANLIVTILNSATGLLILAAIVIYFGGIAMKMRKTGAEDAQGLRTYILWGVVIIFVMVSIWGILELIQTTIFSGDRLNPSTGANDTASFSVPQLAE